MPLELTANPRGSTLFGPTWPGGRTTERRGYQWREFTQMKPIPLGQFPRVAVVVVPDTTGSGDISTELVDDPSESK